MKKMEIAQRLKKRCLLLILAGCFFTTLLSCRQALAIDQTLLLKLLEAKRESYLSKRGEIYLDLIPNYSQDEAVIPWNIIKSSSYGLGVNLRTGLTNRLETTIKIPYSSNYKKIFTSKWDTSQSAGAGDPSLTVQYELQTETYEKPALYLLLGTTVPLARSYFDNLGSNELPIGNGYFSSDLGMSFLKSIDPTVIYGGFDYQLNFKRGTYDPGDQILYNGGIGFALNQQVCLSFGLSGAYITEDRNLVNGVDQPVTDAYNRIGLNLGATFVIDPSLNLNPNIFIGLTKEETDVAFSFGITRKLKEASR